MAREFGSGTWRYVNLDIGNTTLKYVHLSKLKDSLKTEFGQVDVTRQFNVQNAVLSPNQPKPARAAKRFADGHESGFCASDKLRALKNDGFSITRAKLPSYNQTTLSRVLYVNINGVKYAWRRPRKVGGDQDLTPIGVQDASGQTDLVFGADFPKPAQAKILLDGQGSYQSFVDDSKVDGSTLDAGASGAGWALSSPQQIDIDALINLLKL